MFLSSSVWVDPGLELCFCWNAGILDPCSFQQLEKLKCTIKDKVNTPSKGGKLNLCLFTCMLEINLTHKSKLKYSRY